MTSSKKPLNVKNILGLAGKGAFDRGEAYYREGRIASFSQSGNQISAVVEGQSPYHVHLRHTAKQFEGSCDCPASEGFDFCKHCVAVSLHYLEKLEKGEKLKASTGRELLTAYLGELDKDTLIMYLLEHIEDNQILLQNWMLKAEAAAEKLDARSLKKHLTKAIPYSRHLYRYPQVRDYFAKVELVLETIGEHAAAISADDIVKLVEYAMKRITRALETIDDSGGFRFHSLELLGELHLRALDSCDWADEEIATHLLRIYFGDSADFYPPIPQYYLQTVSDKAIDLFHDLLHQRWEMLPVLEPDELDRSNKKFLFLSITRPLLQRARRMGDRKLEIQYLGKGATTVHDMIELSELELQEANISAAWKWLGKARESTDKSSFRFHHDGIVNQEVKLLLAEDKTDDALNSRWTAFKQQPSLFRYQDLTALAEQTGDTNGWHQKSVELLTGKLRDNAGDRCVEELARIYLHTGNPGDALELAEQYRLSEETQTQIIMRNLSQLDRCLALAGDLVRMHTGHSNNNRYMEAIALLKSIHQEVPAAGKTKVLRLVKDAAEEFKAKRNFKKWLLEEFDLTDR